MRLRLALSGILAAVAGIAAGHLVAGFLDPASSPVLAIGSTVIDLTPTPVKEWAIATFGTNDKLILQGSVLLVTLVLAAVAGLLARRRMPLAVGLIVLLTGLAGAAALLRPAPVPSTPCPPSPPWLVGVATLVWLARLAGASGDADRAAGLGADLGARPSARSRGAAPSSSAARSVSPRSRCSPPSVASCAAGPRRSRRSSCPPPLTRPSHCPPASRRRSRASRPCARRPTSFYRVDTNLTVPRSTSTRWTLEIDGDGRAARSR